MKIKQHCWQIKGTDTTYFLKKYTQLSTYKKVAMIHQQLQQDLPFLAKSIACHEPFIVFKWLQARSVDYSNVNDCRVVYDMLDKLHKEGTILIDRLPPLQLEAKWHYRLLHFESLQAILEPLLHRYFFDIVRIANYTLQRGNFPKGDVTLLHGDVAHHNFLRNDDSYYMIDVDLAVAGVPAEEFILWIHRLLPHYQYNLFEIIEAIPELQEYERYFPLLLFPNELLREWLFFYDVDVMQPYLMALTEMTLENWPRLHTQIHSFI